MNNQSQLKMQFITEFLGRGGGELTPKLNEICVHYAVICKTTLKEASKTFVRRVKKQTNQLYTGK